MHALCLATVCHDKTPPHPEDMAEVQGQLPGCSQNQAQCLPQALISTAACREVANAQQEAAEKTEKYYQLEEYLMT